MTPRRSERGGGGKDHHAHDRLARPCQRASGRHRDRGLGLRHASPPAAPAPVPALPVLVDFAFSIVPVPGPPEGLTPAGAPVVERLIIFFCGIFFLLMPALLSPSKGGIRNPATRGPS